MAHPHSLFFACAASTLLLTVSCAQNAPNHDDHAPTGITTTLTTGESLTISPNEGGLLSCADIDRLQHELGEIGASDVTTPPRMAASGGVPFRAVWPAINAIFIATEEKSVELSLPDGVVTVTPASAPTATCGSIVRINADDTFGVENEAITGMRSAADEDEMMDLLRSTTDSCDGRVVVVAEPDVFWTDVTPVLARLDDEGRPVQLTGLLQLGPNCW